MVKIIANEQEISKKIEDIADKFISDCPNVSNLILVGIQRRGVEIAQRLINFLKEKYEYDIPLGVLDITFYRDDLSMVAEQPVIHSTNIPFSLDGKYVILVDDVVYTGRTIRSALDALVDFGRPSIVRLFALVDRGLRELPIQPDYTGWFVETNQNDKISVKVKELDGEDAIELLNK